MLQKIKQTRGGFTLVEIMIVVAIIALLASIAVPNFMRARQRAQATTILEEARMVDAARDQYAIEANVASTATVTFAQLQPYLKAGSRLETSGGQDSYGGVYVITPMSTPVAIADTTIANFDTSVVPATFWGNFNTANRTTTTTNP
ncbi:MAG: competence type IV pilus major pilin ComGC [Chthoniobacteraceae bacterium]